MKGKTYNTTLNVKVFDGSRKWRSKVIDTIKNTENVPNGYWVCIVLADPDEGDIIYRFCDNYDDADDIMFKMGEETEKWTLCHVFDNFNSF